MATLEELRAERARRQDGASAVPTAPALDALKAERARRQQPSLDDRAAQMAADGWARGREANAPPVSTAGGMAAAATDGILAGGGDEYLAGLSALLGVQPDGQGGANWFDYSKPMGDRYSTALGAIREEQAQFAEDHPVAAMGAEITGAVVGPGKIASVASKAAPRVPGLAQAAIGGAATGGAFAFNEGEGGAAERLKAVPMGAALGGLFGAGAQKGVQAIGRLPARIQRTWSRAAQRPTVENLKAAKTVAYRAIDDAQERFTGQDMAELFGKVRASFGSGNYVAETDNASRAALTLLERRAGQETSLPQLDKIRQNLWDRYRGAKDQPIILDAIKAIDDFMDSKAGVSELYDVARAANRRFRNAELLDDAFRKADDQVASTGSGGNTVNKYRQAVTNIINNPRKAQFFSEDEINVMRAFVRGSGMENAQRLFGKLGPNGNGLMMALHIVGGAATGGASLPIMGVGAVSHKLAERSAMRGAEGVKDAAAGHIRPALPTVAGPSARAGMAAQPGADRANRRYQQLGR